MTPFSKKHWVTLNHSGIYFIKHFRDGKWAWAVGKGNPLCKRLPYHLGGKNKLSNCILDFTIMTEKENSTKTENDILAYLENIVPPFCGKEIFESTTQIEEIRNKLISQNHLLFLSPSQFFRYNREIVKDEIGNCDYSRSEQFKLDLDDPATLFILSYVKDNLSRAIFAGFKNTENDLHEYIRNLVLKLGQNAKTESQKIFIENFEKNEKRNNNKKTGYSHAFGELVGYGILYRNKNYLYKLSPYYAHHGIHKFLYRLSKSGNFGLSLRQQIFI